MLPDCHIFHNPLPRKVALPKDFCSVLITNVVGIADPKWYQLNTHHGTADGACGQRGHPAAPHGRRGQVHDRDHDAEVGAAEHEQSRSMPKAIRRPATACAVNPVRNAAMGTTSSPSAEFTNGLAKTTASTTTDQTAGTSSRRKIRAAHTANAAESTTVRTPRPSTGSSGPANAVTQMAAASISTFSRDVAVLDSSAG